MIDRSLNELRDWIATKAKGEFTIAAYQLYLSGWTCHNARNFLKADKCFKIVTCDPIDDTIDQFVSTMAGIGQQAAKHNYLTEDYRRFFESLQFLSELEDLMYLENDWGLDEYNNEILTSVQSAENQMLK